ncbi:MAG: protein kinase [Verrucomicrobiota bacterium]
MGAEPHTVLIVDDEEEVATLLAHQLSSLPFVIVPTSSPAEALHILKTKNVAVLLCDLVMPDIDGNQVLATAREHNPNIVSIAVTGNVDQALMIRAINEGGIWKYIAKPWKRQEILDLVSEGVDRYAALCQQQSRLQQLAREITDARVPAATDLAKSPTVRISKKELRAGWLGRTFAPRAEAGLGSKRYKLVKVLGVGGMGTVYKAEDLLLQMPVAIKVLSAKFTRDQAAVAALKEEARIAMQLSHRHIVRIHNLQKAGGRYFLVMEYVKGRTLRDILDNYKRLPVETVLQVVRVCSDALSYAHRHGVLHKDLKPTNVMLAEDGVLKIIDFGIAGLLGVQRDQNEIVGTLIYMSPEQVRGQPLDARTDVYSLGIIAYELLTGRNPFPAGTDDPAVVTRGPGELTGLPPHLRNALQRAVSARPADRWPSVEAFAAALVDVARPAGAPSAG